MPTARSRPKWHESGTKLAPRRSGAVRSGEPIRPIWRASEPRRDRRRRRQRSEPGRRSGSSPRGGDLAVDYLEANDLATAFTILATSPEPFDRWFRNHVRHVHGAVLEEGLVISELALDFDFDINRI